MAVKTLAVACTLLLGLCIITSGRTIEATQAYCKAVWLLALPCSQVNMAIVSQIKAMVSYKLGPVTPSEIQANHFSGGGQMESLNFTMIPTSMGVHCHVDGLSKSELWFSKFNNITNYCNLHNVMQGSGLTQAPGFVEFTNEWLCLGYELSSCKLS